MDLQPIQEKIYEIRGYRVMLDFDLAGIYQVETRVLNQAVSRNMKRFPDDFMFQLTKEEFAILKSQIVISSWGGTRKLPFAFTEHGVTMLSSVLRSDVAIDASILVVRAFVAIRQLVVTPSDRLSELESQVRELKECFNVVFNDQNDINEDTRMQLELINEALAELQALRPPARSPRRRIGFRTDEEDEFI